MLKENSLAVFENFKIRRIYDEKGNLVFLGGGHYRGADSAAGLPGGPKVLEKSERTAEARREVNR